MYMYRFPLAPPDPDCLLIKLINVAHMLLIHTKQLSKRSDSFIEEMYLRFYEMGYGIIVMFMSQQKAKKAYSLR